MNNFEKIREIISNLPPVGTYTRPDQSVVPAVWYGAEPPSEYKVKGIEIIVTEGDYGYTIPVGSPGSRLRTSKMEVTLVNHDRGSAFNANFKKFQLELVEKMRVNYPSIEIESMPGTNNILEQFTVRATVIEQTRRS